MHVLNICRTNTSMQDCRTVADCFSLLLSVEEHHDLTVDIAIGVDQEIGLSM